MIPTQFWCNYCDAWRPVYDDDGQPLCTTCGEPFVCQECGYDIDRRGECQRPEGCGVGQEDQ